MKKNYQSLLIAAVLLLCSSSLHAQDEQELPSYFHTMESRFYASVSTDFTIFNEEIGVKFSPEARFISPFEYDKLFLNLGLEYEVKDLFEVGIGGSYIFNTTKKGVKQEGRLNVDIGKKIKLFDKFTITPNVRFRNYYEDAEDIADNDLKDNNLRYKVSLSYKHKKKALIEPDVSVGLVHNLTSGLLSDIRYAAGGDLRIDKNNFISAKYILNQTTQTRIITNILEIGYKYKIK